MSPIGVLFHQRPRSALLSEPVNPADLRGILHLIGLIFISNNCREIVDNCLKYGWAVRWTHVGTHVLDHISLLVGSTIVLILAGCGYLLEYYRGQHFAAAWSQVIREMQEIELQLQAARASHNIYSLMKPTPTLSGESSGHHQGETSLKHRTSSAAAAGVTESSSVGDSRPNLPTEEEEEEEDARAEASGIEKTPFGLDDEDEDDFNAAFGHRGTAGQIYKKAAQRYIDATKAIDLSKVLTAAEGYVRQQHEKIKVIKDEINDFMHPLVNVYNHLSLRITESQVETVHCLKAGTICVLMLILPYTIILYSSFDPISALFMLLLSSTWFLKLISFHHTLHNLRQVIISDTKSLRSIVPFDDERASYLHYPYSLSFKHYVTYIVAPTLCFQFNYPRGAHRNWSRIFRVFGQLLFSLVLLKIIFEQYLTRILENAFSPLTLSRDLFGISLHFFERLLKLSTPTLYCWLLMFLSFFHCWMILLAELTRFEDQEFYKDWWNATSFSEYWRKWNLPVHHFCRRHIYLPMIKNGFSKYFSGQLVFILSALAHEYIIAGSMKLGFTGLVFLSFILQTPLSFLTESNIIKKKPQIGNALFWIVFSFTGHPMGVLIFYYLWNIKTGTIKPIQSDHIKNLPIYRNPT